MTVRLFAAVSGIVAMTVGCASVPKGELADPVAHPDRTHESMIVLDTHLDTPVHFARPGWKLSDRHDLARDIAQVDLPRMRDGGLDGGFFVVFTEQDERTDKGYADALRFARGRLAEIDREVTEASSDIVFATTAEQARTAHRDGRLFAFRSMENSYPLGDDLSLLREFRDGGIVMAGPVHSLNNQFGDSSSDKPEWHGLSELGRKWVGEMNRLGIIIDASHASDAVFDDLLRLSRAPIILSHTTARWGFDNPRNLDDDRIRRLAAAGGAICVSTIYLSNLNMTAERAELWDQSEHLADLSPSEQVAFARRWNALGKVEPLWGADYDDFVAMLLHVVDVAGSDHVCIGADWDGGGGIRGLEDITRLPKITASLREAGLSDAEIENIWSGNVLRIMEQVKALRSE